MKDLFIEAARVQRFCEDQGWKFCFIGGIAVQRWAEPRLTTDMDMTLFTGFGGEEAFVDPFLHAFAGRRPDARQFALTNRVLLLRTPEGTGLDVGLGAFPFEQSAIERSSVFTFFGDVSLRTCSAEDLIVMKAFADRPRDWDDVRFTIVRQDVKQLDWKHIYRHLTELAAIKEAPEILEQLRALEARYRGKH